MLTKSDLEWKRNSKIRVPIAPLGGSSNAVKARVDNTTFKMQGGNSEKKKVINQWIHQALADESLDFIISPDCR